MPVLELERPEVDEEVPTETEPRLQSLLRKLRIGGAHHESALTVIENPRVDGKIGYLFASRFLETKHSRRFEDVYYARINLVDFKIWEVHEYRMVRFMQGFDPNRRLRYDFLVTENGNILQKPTERAYEICFLEPAVYNKHLSDVRSFSHIERVLGEMNLILAKRVRSFRIDPKTKELLLPANYASLETTISSSTFRL